MDVTITIPEGSELSGAILELVRGELSNKEKIKGIIEPVLMQAISDSVKREVTRVASYSSYILRERSIEDALKDKMKEECEKWVKENIGNSNVSDIAKSVAEWSIGNLPNLIIAHVLEGANGGLQAAVMSNYFALNEVRGKISEKLDLYFYNTPQPAPDSSLRELTGKMAGQ